MEDLDLNSVLHQIRKLNDESQFKSSEFLVCLLLLFTMKRVNRYDHRLDFSSVRMNMLIINYM